MSTRRGKRGRRKLSSLSLPLSGGGAGWVTEPGEYEVAQDLFTEFGALRVLSFPIEAEGEVYVNESILNVRNELTAALKRLPDGSASAPNIRGMRDACNEYLQATPAPEGYYGMRPHAEKALRRWREFVYEDVHAIAHGLDLDEAHRLLKRMRESFD